jgi:hypothetical protein
MYRSPFSAWFPPAVFLFASLTGCAESEQAPGPLVRDSAGIQIVESTSPAWAPGEEWRLSEEPMLTIGVGEGAEEYELYDVIGALRVRNGEIAVACRGTNQIRFFDAGGTYLRAVGREGGGPGEFKIMFSMWRMGPDSLAVFEYGNARVSVLGDDGGFGRTVHFDQVPGRPTPIPVGPFADGSFLGRAHMIGYEEPLSEGVHRGTVLFVRWSGVGELLDTEVSRPDGERYHRPLDGRPMMGGPPFGRQFGVVQSAEGWYYGSADRFEIEYLSPEGELQRIIRRGVDNRPVTPDLRGEWLRQARERWARMPAPVLEWRLTMPFPETMPAHESDMATDEDGNLWVPEYKIPTEQPSWAVFDPDGRFLGIVDTPANGFVTDIGSDFILGVWQDELEVEQVKMYRLIKGN